MIGHRQLTIRTRLTLWYAMTFFVTGAALLTLVYVLASRTLVASNARLAVELDRVRVDASSAATTLPDGGQASMAPGDVTLRLEESRGAALQVMITQSALVFGAMTVVAVVVCWLIASRMLRPLRHITHVAERLSHDTLDARIEYDGPADELRKLTITFNTMLDRLSRSFAAQRLFAANASHELRTPLTIIQAAAEKALSRPHRSEPEYRSALATVVTAGQRSERLLVSLLALAQVRGGVAVEYMDLAERAAEATASWPSSGPELVAALAPAPLSADPVLIDLLLRNIIENAIRYNTPDGEVWIRTGTHRGQACLEVENTGPPVSAADIAHLHRPFQRGSHRTGTGHGLGLAIVDAVVTAHHATWRPFARPAGGLKICVWLPGLDDPPPTMNG